MLGSLLGCHVDHQVHNTVAVSILIIVPGDRNKVLSGLTHHLPPLSLPLCPTPHSSASHPLPAHKLGSLSPTLQQGKEETTVMSNNQQSHSTEVFTC